MIVKIFFIIVFSALLYVTHRAIKYLSAYNRHIKRFYEYHLVRHIKNKNRFKFVINLIIVLAIICLIIYFTGITISTLSK